MKRRSAPRQPIGPRRNQGGESSTPGDGDGSGEVGAAAVGREGVGCADDGNPPNDTPATDSHPNAAIQARARDRRRIDCVMEVALKR